VLDDAEPVALLIGHGVDDPGDFDEMRFVMTDKRVELTGDK
jgi:hypothetical protein